MDVPRSLARIAVLAAILVTVGCAQKTPPAASQPSAPVAAAPAGSASAAAPAADILDEIALTRAGIQARRQAIVTAAMDLTAPESAAFWPLYRDYRNDMAKVDDRLVELILVYASHYDSLSDDMATTLLTDYLDVERARLDLKSRYVPQFQRVLPTRKVARFFQIDNKLDKRLQAEVTAGIPLAR